MKALALAFLVACGPTISTIGPYVKHVSRNGDWLVVHKCMIVLEGGHDLQEGTCTVEQFPLRGVPQSAPPMAPQAPAPSGTPVAPPQPWSPPKK